MRGVRWFHVVLLVPLVAVGLWLGQRAGRQRDDPDAVLVALRSSHGPALPSVEAVVARERTEPESYDRETLYDFIDGAADAYLTRGFERCVTANYSFAGSSGALFEIMAELHRFANEQGANEQMSAERPSQSMPVAGLDRAFSDATTLVATRGRDYLKLTTLGNDAASAEMLARLARAVLTQGSK